MSTDSNNKIQELGKNKWHHYNLFKKYDRQLIEARKELEEKCDQHEWLTDSTSIDPCRTQYECSKCGATYR